MLDHFIRGQDFISLIWLLLHHGWVCYGCYNLVLHHCYKQICKCWIIYCCYHTTFVLPYIILQIACCKQIDISTYPTSILSTPWGWVTHICIGKLTIIGSDNGLSHGRLPSHYLKQYWNIYLYIYILNGLLGRYLSEILIGVQMFSFKEMHLKMSSVKWHPFCLGLNMLTANRCSLYQFIQNHEPLNMGKLMTWIH